MPAGKTPDTSHVACFTPRFQVHPAAAWPRHRAVGHLAAAFSAVPNRSTNADDDIGSTASAGGFCARPPGPFTVRLTVSTEPPGRFTSAYPTNPTCFRTVESGSVVDTSDRERKARSTLSPPGLFATSGGSGSVVDSVVTVAPARLPAATVVCVLRHCAVLVRMSSSMSRRAVDTSSTSPTSAALAASTAEFDALTFSVNAVSAVARHSCGITVSARAATSCARSESTRSETVSCVVAKPDGNCAGRSSRSAGATAAAVETASSSPHPASVAATQASSVAATHRRTHRARTGSPYPERVRRHGDLWTAVSYEQQ